MKPKEIEKVVPPDEPSLKCHTLTGGLRLPCGKLPWVKTGFFVSLFHWGRSEDWPPRLSSLYNHLVPAEAMADSSPPASRLLWLWLYTHCGLLNVSHRPTASLNPHNLIRCEQLLNGTLKQSNQAMLKTVRNTIY